jgi:hypothetical protein
VRFRRARSSQRHRRQELSRLRRDHRAARVEPVGEHAREQPNSMYGVNCANAITPTSNGECVS